MYQCFKRKAEFVPHFEWRSSMGCCGQIQQWGQHLDRKTETNKTRLFQWQHRNVVSCHVWVMHWCTDEEWNQWALEQRASYFTMLFGSQWMDVKPSIVSYKVCKNEQKSATAKCRKGKHIFPSEEKTAWSTMRQWGMRDTGQKCILTLQSIDIFIQ